MYVCLSVFVRAPAISTYITLTLAMLVMTCSTRLSRGAMLGCFQASRSHTCVVRETQGRFYLLQSWVTPLFIAFIILRGWSNYVTKLSQGCTNEDATNLLYSFVGYFGPFWAIATYINTLQLLIVTHFASTETSVATASQYRVGEKASELIVETTVRSSSNHVKASEYAANTHTLSCLYG